MFIIKYKHEQWHMKFVVVKILTCYLLGTVSFFGYPGVHGISQEAKELPQILILFFLSF